MNERIVIKTKEKKMEGFAPSCHVKRVNVLISSQAEQEPHLGNKLHVKLEYLQRFALRFNTNETNENCTRNFRCGFSLKRVKDTNMCISKLRILRQ